MTTWRCTCESWDSLSKEKLLILRGWQKCVVEHFDIENEDERKKAVREQVRSTIAIDAVPAEKEDEEVDGFCAEQSEDEDDEKTEKEIMKEKVYGERKSGREKKPAAAFGYQLNSQLLKFS